MEKLKSDDTLGRTVDAYIDSIVVDASNGSKLTPKQNRERLKQQKLTDWELGNEILFKIIDACSSLASECKETHPEVATKLQKMRVEACEIYRDLVKEGALV